MSRCCANRFETQQTTARRRPNILGLLVQIVFLYVLFVFGGGTLINTGHPVAVEVGRLMHTITFVQPAMHAAADNGYPVIETGLQTLADGYPIS